MALPNVPYQQFCLAIQKADLDLGRELEVEVDGGGGPIQFTVSLDDPAGGG